VVDPAIAVRTLSDAQLGALCQSTQHVAGGFFGQGDWRTVDCKGHAGRQVKIAPSVQDCVLRTRALFEACDATVGEVTTCAHALVEQACGEATAPSCAPIARCGEALAARAGLRCLVDAPTCSDDANCPSGTTCWRSTRLLVGHCYGEPNTRFTAQTCALAQAQACRWDSDCQAPLRCANASARLDRSLGICAL
jgi:hypothetical protein